MPRVIDLESGYIPSMNGQKYRLQTNLTNGLTVGDILIIKEKSPGFGMEFYSENLNRSFFLNDHVQLEKV